MTRPDDRFRSNEGSGPWLHPPRNEPQRFNVVFWLALCAGVTVATLLIIGISAMAAEIPHYVAGPGFDICTQKGC